MNIDRIKEIQQQTACPESVSVQQALLKVWNEFEQEQKHWFELGKKVELSERTYFTSKEFWFGIILGMLTMYSLIAFDIF